MAKNFHELPAFPRPASELTKNPGHKNPSQEGMSYFEWLVGQALHGYCSSAPDAQPTVLANNAVQAARAACTAMSQPFTAN